MSSGAGGDGEREFRGESSNIANRRLAAGAVRKGVAIFVRFPGESGAFLRGVCARAVTIFDALRLNEVWWVGTKVSYGERRE